jgi:predicted ribosome quality control (RQC) complex YloA/Tae2 family protein
MSNIKTHAFIFENIEYTIYEGKNAQGNNSLLDECSENDIWFHVNNSTSAHIVLSIPTTTTTTTKPPKQVIKRCCCICKASTKTSNKVEIVYTTRSNLEKVNDRGTVTFIDPTKTKLLSL